MPSKVLFVVKKTLFAVRSLRAKIIIVDNSKFGEGKRRNEFVEWHVAWLAERHNYVESNICRVTQRNKLN